MTKEDEILKELKWQTKLLESNFAVLNQIKFDLQNARIMEESTYKIPVGRKQKVWDRFRSLFK